MRDTKENTSKKNGLMIAVIAAAVIIILLLVAVIFLLAGRSGDDPEPTPSPGGARGYLVTEESVGSGKDLSANLPADRIPVGQFQITMNSEWYFEEGTLPSTNAYVENVDLNTHDVYFDVMLADTNEVILQSPIIPRGGQMSSITLDKDLDPGTYDCLLVYNLVDEAQNVVSTVNVAVTIVVAG